MGILVSEIKYLKSEVVTNLDGNGGRKGQTEVQSGIRHALFPRVTKTERTNGVTRYRKQFWTNTNGDDDTAYDVIQWLGLPSTGGDRFYLKKGTQTDTQVDVASDSHWTGCGQLALNLSGGESQIKLAMENNDFTFTNGALLHISNKVSTSQTIDSNVNVGDSVLFSLGTWSKISRTSDVEYPNGICVGTGNVFTNEATTKEEWVTIAENLNTSENIGTGNGTATPSLSTLSSVTNGVSSFDGMLPQVLTLDASDAVLTANFDEDGNIITGTSDASAGALNMTNGTWTTTIVWTTAPGSAKAIEATYRQKPYSYSGNTATIDLEDTVSYAYTVAKTHGSGCVKEEEVVATLDSWAETSSAGTYDETANPVLVHNQGAEEDTITIQFTSASTFDVTGANLGSLGTGFSVASNCVPVNPNNGQNMFTLDNTGWAGTWATNDTVVFNLHPSSKPIWMKEVVPAGTSQESHNLMIVGWYSE